jgi:hypothetical protein
MKFDLLIPEHAYLYGFLLTDGHLRRDGRASIEIKESDLDVLLSFQSIVESAVTTRERQTNFGFNKTSVWTTSNKIFCKTLISWGFPVGKKSKIIDEPITEYSEPDFFRGIIDGDGSMGFKKKVGVPYVSLCTDSEVFATSYIRFISKTCNTYDRIANRNKRDNAFNIVLHSEPAQHLVSYMYYPGCLSLKRKMVTAQSILDWQRPKKMKKFHSSKPWDPMEELYIISHTIDESITYLKRTRESIRQHIKVMKAKNEN